MAIVIDESWLKEQGIDAEGKEAEELIDGVMDELEMRSGMAIADKLTDTQMAEFDAIEDDGAREDWLDKAVPEYPDIVEAKVGELESELAAAANKAALIKKWAQG